MKRKAAIVSALFILLFTSCQKELELAAGSGSTGAGLLVKMVEKTGTDSTVVEYSYDAAKRLVREKISGMSGGINLDNDLKIIRNSSGIITHTVQKAAELIASGVDSVITRYHYDAPARRYTSSVFELSLFGFTVSDSTVYKYDAGGKITSDEHYQAFTGVPYELTLKQEYTYSAPGTAVVVFKQYTYDATTSSYDLIATLDYTYDNKTNPLPLNIGNEAVVLLRPVLFSSNNALSSKYTDPDDASNNFSTAIVYTYSNNRPGAAVSTDTPSGKVSNIKYYYQ